MARASTDPADARLHELLRGDLSADEPHAEALALLRAHPAMAQARDYVVAQASRGQGPPGGPARRPGPRRALEAFADAVAVRSA